MSQMLTNWKSNYRVSPEGANTAEITVAVKSSVEATIITPFATTFCFLILSQS
jgi:hypothetical protein